MSKYDVDGGFDRVERDFYPTPVKATLPLKNSPIGHKLGTYWEPCCADGQLVDGLKSTLPSMKCVMQSDLVTTTGSIMSVFDIASQDADALGIDCFITNPPWINTSKDGYQLFSMVYHLAKIRPTLMLLNANICWNKGSWQHPIAPMPICDWVKPIGRVKWIADSKHSGKEDCAWFLFDNSSVYAKMHPTTILPRD